MGKEKAAIGIVTILLSSASNTKKEKKTKQNQKPSLYGYKHKNPSASRNQGPILEVLKKLLNADEPNLKLLEISSGTGQHAAFIADNFPNIEVQSSEFDKSMLPSIRSYVDGCKNKNAMPPICIDIRTDYTEWSHQFTAGSFDYMLNINMIHISPWECTEMLFRNASALVKTKGFLITYGPYSVNGVLAPESNIRFNAMLKSQNSEWGVRDIKDIQLVATRNNFVLKNQFDMPANNKTLVWEKT